MKIANWNPLRARKRLDEAGMTLIEVVMAMLISAISVSCMVLGYVFSINSAERSALSLAASNRAMERIEETRSARWDVESYPIVDQLTNTSFPTTVVVLDISASGLVSAYGTNFTSIYQVSSDPPLRGVRVDCVWRFRDLQLMTNTIETFRGPD